MTGSLPAAMPASQGMECLKNHMKKSLITRLVDGFGTGETTMNSDEELPSDAPLLRPLAAPTPADVEQPPQTETDEDARRRRRQLLKRSNAAVWDQADLSALAMCDSDGAPAITNPRIWWRHPVMRLLAVWSVLFMDFYIYGADPVQDFHLNYQFFGVFEDMFILESKWPSKTKFKVIRIALAAFCLPFSLTVGRWIIHHRILRDFFGLKMFAGTQGVGVVNFLTFAVTFEYILPYPINYIESGTATSPITEESVLKFYEWGKIWQSTAAVADLLSITMITDAVLQDRKVWPNWAPGLKWVWNDLWNGWVRILAPYFFLGGLVPLIIYGLWKDDKSNGIYTVEKAATGNLATTQAMRVLVAALLTMIDIMTCLQDWEFPAYSSPADFKVVGTGWSQLDIPFVSEFFKWHFGNVECIKPEFWESFHFQMSGKWIAYLPAFAALGVDWWYLARTIFPYKPQKFAQYERPEDGIIFTITNDSFIESVYNGGKLDPKMVREITYEARKGLEKLGDVAVQSRFSDDPWWLKCVPLALGIGAGVAFIVLVFRAEYYWDTYSQRVDKDEVEKKLREHYEQTAITGAEE